MNALYYFPQILFIKSHMLDFSTDWSMNIDFKKPISYLIDGLNWQIGTYPFWTSEVMRSDGGSFSIEVKSDSTSASAPFYAEFAFLFIIAVFYKKK